MKKCFLIILCFIISFPLLSIEANAVSLGISASSAVVMVAQTGEVIYEHNAHTKRSMASTTKIMTSLIALEKCDLKKEIIVKSEQLKVEGTSMGLLDGDRVTYEALVHGMLLQSGNDAANVVAANVGGDIDGFVDMMNVRAKELGMKNTNFVTPSGLDAETHYSTAYDMAVLGSAAILNPDFRRISSLKKATVSYGNPPYNRTLTNHNKMLSYYDGCIGLKTGFTKKSGRCLVTAAERNGVVLVAVTLNAPDDWNDHKILLDYGFSEITNSEIITEIMNIPVVGGTKTSVSVMPSDKTYINTSDSFSEYDADYLLDSFLYAPVEKGDNAGKIVCTVDGRRVVEVILIAGEDIPAKCKKQEKKSFWIKVKEFFKRIFKK